MSEEVKRLFFGLDMKAPWPLEFPAGRIMEENNRHMTVLFLGNVSFDKVKNALRSFPKPDFKVGFAGICDECHILPKHGKPRVAAWHVSFPEHQLSIVKSFQKKMVNWGQENNFAVDDREFFPHVTLCRAPFVPNEWRKAFSALPCISGSLHLYESKGNMKYEPIWSIPLIYPIEEIEHTADIAYIIRGEDLSDLHWNAQIALAFRSPEMFPFLSFEKGFQSLDQIITKLNQLICKIDAEFGTPFKAVSFHGNIVEEQNFLTWEMIIDV